MSADDRPDSSLNPSQMQIPRARFIEKWGTEFQVRFAWHILSCDATTRADGASFKANVAALLEERVSKVKIPTKT